MTEGYQEKEYIPLPELAYTAEVEKTGEYITLLAGYYGKYILDYQPADSDPELSFDMNLITEMMNSGVVFTPGLLNDEIQSRIGAFNRLYNYQMQDLYHSAFVILKGDLFHNLLEIALPVIYNFTTREWTIRPGLTYKPYDGIHIQAGYEGYIGPSGSLYDLVGPVLNSGYLSLKVMF